MEETRAPRYLLFRVLIVVGGVLGVLLLVQSVRTYQFVARRLVEDDLWRQAARHAVSFSRQVFQANAHEPEELEAIFREALQEERNLVWVRVLGPRGEVLAEAGEASGAHFSAQHVAMLLDPTARLYVHANARGGPVLVALFPFRPRLRGRPPAGLAPEGRPRAPSPRYAAIEIAIAEEAAGPSFAQLRRNLVVSVSAAVALLASMGILGLRLNHYVRGKQFEQQVALARRVQQDLLPSGCPDCKGIDFAAACEPAWQVGGDFYDIFPVDGGRIAIILGDVSGKGVPAALLMSLLHGAVRSATATGEGRTLEDACRHLNQLLTVRTSVERFASLIWCLYDPRDGCLSYVNAGHLPPLVLRAGDAGHAAFERLECGGPVMGVLTDASYRQGQRAFGQGDVLIMFSDGLVEATNADGEEFGEARLAGLVREHWRQPAAEIRDRILEQVHEFIGRRPLDDDLTLLVVKGGTAPSTRIS